MHFRILFSVSFHIWSINCKCIRLLIVFIEKAASFRAGIPGDGRCLFRSVAHGACVKSGKPPPDENLQRQLADELRTRVCLPCFFNHGFSINLQPPSSLAGSLKVFKSLQCVASFQINKD